MNRCASFSLIEIVVTVLILSSLLTLGSLEFQQRREPETFKANIRQLSQFLQAAIRTTTAKGSSRTLTIDTLQGRFSLHPSSGPLDTFILEDGIKLVQCSDSEENTWDDDIIEVNIPTSGIKNSIQMTFEFKDLEPWTLTWKLGGSICSIDQSPEIHWPEEVERF